MMPLLLYNNILFTNNIFRNHKPISTVWEKNGYEITHHFEFEPPMTPPPVVPSSRPSVEPPIVNRRPIPANRISGPIDLTSEAASIAGIANSAPIPAPNHALNIPKPQQTGQLNMRTDIGSKRPSVSQELLW